MQRLHFPAWYWFGISLFLTSTVTAPLSFVLGVLAPASVFASFDFIALVTWIVAIAAPVAWTTARRRADARKLIQTNPNDVPWFPPPGHAPGREDPVSLAAAIRKKEAEAQSSVARILSLQRQIVQDVETILVSEIPRAAATLATAESSVTLALGTGTERVRAAVAAYAAASPSRIRSTLEPESVWPLHDAGRSGVAPLENFFPQIGRALEAVMDGLRSLMREEGYSARSGTGDYGRTWASRVPARTRELLVRHRREVTGLTQGEGELARLRDELRSAEAELVWSGAGPAGEVPARNTGRGAGMLARVPWPGVIVAGAAGTLLLAAAVPFVLAHPAETLPLPSPETIDYELIAGAYALLGLLALWITRLGTRFRTLAIHSQVVAVSGVMPGAIAISAGILMIVLPVLFWAAVLGAIFLVFLVVVEIADMLD